MSCPSDEVTPTRAGEHPSARTRWLLLWSLLVIGALAWGMGGYPLFEPDEGRNAEVAREMVESGDYLRPQLNGLPYVDKPALPFAATAVSMRLLGASELAARLVPLLFGLATAVATGLFGARLWGATAGWLAALAAATAPLAFGLSRVVILDTMLSFCVVAAILAFYMAVEVRRNGGPALRWTLVAWTAIALGILTKGPVALAFPLLVVTPYCGWRRQWTAVYHPLSLLPLVLLVGPWVWIMSEYIPGYLSYVAVTETWQRVASDELHRTQPVYFFIQVAAIGFFPWWLVAAAAAKSPWRRRPGTSPDHRIVFLLLWIVLPVVLFSLSRSKQPQYILPLAPAIALLAVAGWETRAHRRIGFAAAALGLVVVGSVLLAIAGGFFVEIERIPELLRPKVPGFAAALGLSALVAAAISWSAAIRGRPTVAFVALSLPIMVLPVAGGPLLEAAADRRSYRQLAAQIEPHLTPDTEVLSISAWRPSLNFYLRRIVPVASPGDDPLRSNYILRFHDDFLTDDGPLRPQSTAWAALAGCDRPRIFITGGDFEDIRARIEAAGVPLIGSHRRLVAYGPHCGGDAAER